MTDPTRDPDQAPPPLAVQMSSPPSPAAAAVATLEPRGLLNSLLVRRKDQRGDLVGSLALWAFLGLLVCLVLGGSSVSYGGTDARPLINLMVPELDWQSLVALLTPVVAHTVKSTVEGAP
jgi:hypothetical protein